MFKHNCHAVGSAVTTTSELFVFKCQEEPSRMNSRPTGTAVLASERQWRDFQRVACVFTTRARLDNPVVEFTFWTQFRHVELSIQACNGTPSAASPSENTCNTTPLLDDF